MQPLPKLRIFARASSTAAMSSTLCSASNPDDDDDEEGAAGAAEVRVLATELPAKDITGRKGLKPIS